MVSEILTYGLSMMRDMERNMEAWKERIRDDWNESKKFPRKKKKQVRKRLLLEWQIANYTPFM